MENEVISLCVANPFGRFFAYFSIAMFLHASAPLSSFDPSTSLTKASSIGAMAEVEDEHSEVHLKILIPKFSIAAPTFFVFHPNNAENPIFGFIEEIPTPPPLN